MIEDQDLEVPHPKPVEVEPFIRINSRDSENGVLISQENKN